MVVTLLVVVVVVVVIASSRSYQPEPQWVFKEGIVVKGVTKEVPIEEVTKEVPIEIEVVVEKEIIVEKLVTKEDPVERTVAPTSPPSPPPTVKPTPTPVPSSFITLGSTKAEVQSVQGTPTKVFKTSGFLSTGEERWYYARSEVEFDRHGRVKAYDDKSSVLKLK